MSCDIIMPVWDQLKLTKRCLESITRHTHYPYRMIIIDNGSDKNVKEYLKDAASQTRSLLIRNEENLGFIKAVNQGLKSSSAEYLCIINNDTVVTDGWLGEMIDIARLKKEIGLINPSSNNLGQHTGRDTVDEYAAKLKQLKGQYIELGSSVGFCMLMKRRLFEEIGYLDEIYRGGNFDDTDYSRRAEKKGYFSVRAKGAYVYHEMKSSFAKIRDYEESFSRNRDIYNSRWGRPKRLAYIVTRTHGNLFNWMASDITKKARGGNWVWLFFKGTDNIPEIGEHSNVKMSLLPSFLFKLNCIVRILKKKKKFDTIFVDDPDLIEKIKSLKRFHKAETMLMGG